MPKEPFMHRVTFCPVFVAHSTLAFAQATQPVKFGIDCLAMMDSNPPGQRVGIVANPASVDANLSPPSIDPQGARRERVALSGPSTASGAMNTPASPSRIARTPHTNIPIFRYAKTQAHHADGRRGSSVLIPTSAAQLHVHRRTQDRWRAARHRAIRR
jgi:hypothetical protein